MKTSVTALFFLVSCWMFACESHFYRLSLNQRSFYNPAALCPYCKGSTFAASGFSITPASGDFSYHFSAGDDGENRLHGPWDFSFGQMQSGNTKLAVYSMRYAWSQKIADDWRLAAGFRTAYVNYSSQYLLTDDVNIPVSSNLQSRFFDFDGGLMLTNRKGFYLGVSAQHLSQPYVKEADANRNIFKERIPRSYSLNSGTVLRLSRHFDLMPELNLVNSEKSTIAQPACMVRYNHHLAIGSGVLLAKNESPQFDIRGGYTSSVFKLLGGIAFTPDGIVAETGIVYRFKAERWHIRRISDPCTGGNCIPVVPDENSKPKKREFDPHQ